MKRSSLFRPVAALLIVVTAAICSVLPIFAASAPTFIPMTITESSAVARRNLAVTATISNTNLQAYNYLSATALNSAVTPHGAAISDCAPSIPLCAHMVVNDRTIFWVPSLPSLGSMIEDYQLGWTPALSQLSILTGTGGLITTADAAALEPGSGAWSIAVNGYIDTSVTGRLFSKNAALLLTTTGDSSTVTGTVAATVTQNYSSTGAPVTLVVPSDVVTITIDARGAAGGAGGTGTGAGGAGGLGARVQSSSVTVVSGETLTINVGGAGGVGGNAGVGTAGTAGYNGGAAGGISPGFVASGGGGGGGSTTVSGSTTGLVVTASGGGGGGGGGAVGTGAGGAGGAGAQAGTAGSGAGGGGAGGGAANQGGASGSAGTAGSGNGGAGGGGSGGVNGGGGGSGTGNNAGGGGGGSGSSATTGGSPTFTSGSQAGAGALTITYVTYTSTPTVTLNGITPGAYTITFGRDANSHNYLTSDGSIPTNCTPSASCAAAVAVPDNANAWLLMSSATPYLTSYTQTVGANQEVLYAPVTLITGTTLPDRSTVGGHNGVFTFGANPSGVTVSLGSIAVPAPAVFSGSNTEPQFGGLAPISSTPPAGSFYPTPTGANPFINTLLVGSSPTGAPAKLIYLLVGFGISMLVGFLVFWATRSALVCAMAMAVCMVVGGISQVIAWIWVIPFVILALAFLAVYYRT